MLAGICRPCQFLSPVRPTVCSHPAATECTSCHRTPVAAAVVDGGGNRGIRTDQGSTCQRNSPQPSATTCIVTDASDTAVGEALQQFIDGVWSPISFFSKKLKPPETRYSAFDRELLAVYLAIKHFRHFVKGREFHVHTDHKPLTYALGARADHHTPRQIRQLDYICQFTSDLRHFR